MDDEWAKEIAEEEAERARLAIPAPSISREEFLAWRSPRNADINPARLDNPLWVWMVQTRRDAYNANNMFDGPSSFDSGPMWCFQRFGMSETTLPDGRLVYIAGEHEDAYDPDFHIYNDVIVVSPSGEIAIYGYPAKDFAPTDFHSATLVGDAIYVIGSLGYPEQRNAGITPVYRLELASMKISAVATMGDAPGWISRHSGKLSDDNSSIIVSGGEIWTSAEQPTKENIDSWALNIASGEWQRLTENNWQHWFVRREDRQRMRFWDTRQEQWLADHQEMGIESYWRHAEPPNLAALKMLYRFDHGGAAPVEGAKYNEFSVTIDGLLTRFREGSYWLEIIVEGQLTQQRLSALQSHLLEFCSQLESSPCVTVS